MDGSGSSPGLPGLPSPGRLGSLSPGLGRFSRLGSGSGSPSPWVSGVTEAVGVGVWMWRCRRQRLFRRRRWLGITQGLRRHDTVRYPTASFQHRCTGWPHTAAIKPTASQGYRPPGSPLRDSKRSPSVRTCHQIRSGSGVGQPCWLSRTPGHDLAGSIAILSCSL